MSKHFNERGQIDLIDIQNLPDGKFKWILYYHDWHSMFVSLRPLETNKAAEVAFDLLKIFSIFGAPKILQSSDGQEFVRQVINELKMMWPECIIDNTTQLEQKGCMQDLGQNIEILVKKCISENQRTDWYIGLYIFYSREDTFFTSKNYWRLSL